MANDWRNFTQRTAAEDPVQDKTAAPKAETIEERHAKWERLKKIVGTSKPNRALPSVPAGSADGPDGPDAQGPECPDVEC